MSNFRKHIINFNSTIEQSLIQLNNLGKDAILFVEDKDKKLVGTLTDGDVRRGLIKGISIYQSLNLIIQPNPKFIRKGDFDIKKIIEYRDSNFRIIPVIDKADKIINVINFRELHSYIPVDAVIMAGGKGQRLLPLTLNTPKPLLVIGEKPIIDHNITRLASFGIDDFWISVKYLGEQIENYFGNGSSRNINFKYIWEDEPLGTIGAVSKIKDFNHEYILISNSDILTNLDYEHFFLDFIDQDADMSIVTIPYQVNIPYAVLETNNSRVCTFKEKPTYTYYSNGGIYLVKKSIISLLPYNQFFDATDLIAMLIEKGNKIISYPLNGYWLDIGNPQDFAKAQVDIKNIKF